MKFKVTNQPLSNAIDSMQEELNAIQDECSAIYKSLNELDAMWKGPAHDTFVAGYITDHESMETLIQSIQSVIDNMKDAKIHYRATEDAISQAIRMLLI